MSEVYGGFGGAAAAEPGSNAERIARLTVGRLGRAVIECDDTGPHYDESGAEFHAAKWNDPDPNKIGKFYTLQQFTSPAGSFSYSLRVYEARKGKKPVEWYDFHDGLVHVRNRMDDSRKRLSLAEHQANYERAAGYLRALLADWGYIPPLELARKPNVPSQVPVDIFPGAVFPDADNRLFLAIIANF